MKEKLLYGLLAAELVFGAATGGALITYSVMQRPRPAIREVTRTRTRTVDLEDLTIKKGVTMPVADNLESILNNGLIYNTLGFKKGEWKVKPHKKTKKIPVQDLIKRSKAQPAAQQYVNSLLTKIESTIYTPNTSISNLELAVKGIDLAWKDISGATYTLNRGPTGDSTKTLAEFLAGKKGKLGKLNGDCKDHTVALLTIYELMKETSETRRKQKPFYEKLMQGLLRYQLVGIGYNPKTDQNGDYASGHAMVASLTYSPNFMKVTMSPLEPQVFGLRGQTPVASLKGKNNYFLARMGGKLMLMDGRKRNIKIRKITNLFNSTGHYVPSK